MTMTKEKKKKKEKEKKKKEKKKKEKKETENKKENYHRRVAKTVCMCMQTLCTLRGTTDTSDQRLPCLRDLRGILVPTVPRPATARKQMVDGSRCHLTHRRR